MDRDEHTQLMRDISDSVDHMEALVKEGFRNDYTAAEKQRGM